MMSIVLPKAEETPHETPTCEVGVRGRGMATQSRRCGGPPGPAPVDILSAYRLYAQHYVYEVEAETLPLFYWDDNNRLIKPRTTVTIVYTLATPAVRRSLYRGAALGLLGERGGAAGAFACCAVNPIMCARRRARAISDISRPNAARPGHSMRDGVLAGALDPTCAARCPGVMLRSLRCFASCSVSLT